MGQVQARGGKAVRWQFRGKTGHGGGIGPGKRGPGREREMVMQGGYETKKGRSGEFVE